MGVYVLDGKHTYLSSSSYLNGCMSWSKGGPQIAAHGRIDGCLGILFCGFHIYGWLVGVTELSLGICIQ